MWRDFSNFFKNVLQGGMLPKAGRHMDKVDHLSLIVFLHNSIQTSIILQMCSLLPPFFLPLDDPPSSYHHYYQLPKSIRHWDPGAFIMRPWMQHRPRLLRCVTCCPRAASATIIQRTWTNIFIQKQSQIIFIQCGYIDPNIQSNHFIMAVYYLLFSLI